MSDFTSSELQGLAASLVATPIAVIATAYVVHGAIPGDTGITIASVLCAVVFLAVPRILSGVLGQQAPGAIRRVTAS